VSEPWWRTLLREQRGSGFADLAGADVAITLPVSDRLVTAVVSSLLSPSIPVRSLQLVAEVGNQFAVRIKLKTPALLPPITVRFAIIDQPRLPATAELVCAPVSEGVAIFMGPLLQLFANLPPCVRLVENRFHIDVRALAAQHGLAEIFQYVTELTLATVPGQFVLTIRGARPRLS
jgi:hypothetical protein